MAIVLPPDYRVLICKRGTRKFAVLQRVTSGIPGIEQRERFLLFAGGNYYPTLPAPMDGTLAAPPAPALVAGGWKLLTPGSGSLAPSEFDFVLAAPFQIDGDLP